MSTELWNTAKLGYSDSWGFPDVGYLNLEVLKTVYMYMARSGEYEALYSNPANSVTQSVQDANELSRSCPGVSCGQCGVLRCPEVSQDVFGQVLSVISHEKDSERRSVGS